jgi:hypothetical protein
MGARTLGFLNARRKKAVRRPQLLQCKHLKPQMLTCKGLLGVSWVVVGESP